MSAFDTKWFVVRHYVHISGVCVCVCVSDRMLLGLVWKTRWSNVQIVCGMVSYVTAGRLFKYLLCFDAITNCWNTLYTVVPRAFDI